MVDCDNGFVRIANELLVALASKPIGNKARRVLDIVMRYTYGYNRKEAVIPSQVFIDLTGLTFQDMCRARKQLEMSNIITVGGTRTARTYCINKDYKTWRGFPRQVDLSNQVNSVGLSNQVTPELSNQVKHLANQVTPVGKLDKCNISKDNLKDNIKTCASAMHFESLWAQYPKRMGKKEAFRHYKASVKTEKSKERIEKALASFLDSKYGGDKDVTFIPLGKTWFFNWEEWADGEPVSDSSSSKHTEEY